MAFGSSCACFIWLVSQKIMKRGNSAVNLREIPSQVCPACGNEIGVIPGSRDAICKNCGFKDPCCE